MLSILNSHLRVHFFNLIAKNGRKSLSLRRSIREYFVISLSTFIRQITNILLTNGNNVPYIYLVRSLWLINLSQSNQLFSFVIQGVNFVTCKFNVIKSGEPSEYLFLLLGGLRSNIQRLVGALVFLLLLLVALCLVDYLNLLQNFLEVLVLF